MLQLLQTARQHHLRSQFVEASNLLVLHKLGDLVKLPTTYLPSAQAQRSWDLFLRGMPPGLHPAFHQTPAVSP